MRYSTADSTQGEVCESPSLCLRCGAVDSYCFACLCLCGPKRRELVPDPDAAFSHDLGNMDDFGEQDSARDGEIVQSIEGNGAGLT